MGELLQEHPQLFSIVSWLFHVPRDEKCFGNYSLLCLSLNKSRAMRRSYRHIDLTQEEQNAALNTVQITLMWRLWWLSPVSPRRLGRFRFCWWIMRQKQMTGGEEGAATDFRHDGSRKRGSEHGSGQCSSCTIYYSITLAGLVTH